MKGVLLDLIIGRQDRLSEKVVRRMDRAAARRHVCLLGSTEEGVNKSIRPVGDEEPG